MGLISKEVEVSLSNNNIKHYECLGYEIPRYKDKWGNLRVKRGTKIIVKVEDLKKGSKVKIKVKCDNPSCGKEYELSYQKYVNQNHNGKTYCKKCSNTILISGENNGMFGICRYGENNPNWNPNKTQEEREKGRNYPQYVEFVKKVLIRDSYTCRCCGKESHGDMEVHHLDGYDWCKDKRTDEQNGITLCKTCHKNFHSIYGKGNNTKEQFEEWIGQPLEEFKKYNGALPTTRKIYCIEEDKIYFSAYELAEEWNVDNANVYNVCNHKKLINGYYCKSLKGKHLLWLDEYKKCSEKDIEKYLEWCNNNNNKAIYCITTGEKFNSIKEVSEHYNIYKSNISDCCKGKMKSCGKLEDGTKLQWMYYEDYIKANKTN